MYIFWKKHSTNLRAVARNSYYKTEYKSTTTYLLSHSIWTPVKYQFQLGFQLYNLIRNDLNAF